ncbi:Septin-domain-containing protein [Coniochaeta sp. 2T2.1]|nr:Septin-domain-containing protein [Coniochaeta sp. 2T2.1]
MSDLRVHVAACSTSTIYVATQSISIYHLQGEMRPLPGDDAFARPRRPSDNDLSPLTQQPPQPQMTYVLADESTVDVALEHASAILQQHRAREPRKGLHHREASASSSALSVASSSAAADNDKNVNPREGGRPPPFHYYKNPVEALRHQDDDLLSMSSRPDSPFCPRTCATPNPSQPMTPLMFSTPGPMSAMSSVSSRRNSFAGSFSEDLMHSQVLSVDGTTADVATITADREQPQPGIQASSGAGDMTDSGSAPQLIMPSIKMPSRRPFTETGKAMGRLKVLIAGDSGVGKTSLIKAIVQSCQHIVHVDPITSLSASISLAPRNANASPPPRRGSRQQPSRSDIAGTSQITEVFASTKPYPEWWSELDDSRILKRRKSIEDAVLDRNICFVDTPGYSNAQSAMETITRVVQYAESHLHRLSSNSLADGDILNLVGGDGGVQVDAAFYMVSNRLKPVDIEYLRQLSPLTNIILLLAQSDLLTPEHITTAKQQIQLQLQEANIKPFCFATSSAREEPSYTYAISSALGSDHDNMDASLLMSPDYVQPLIPTELASLVEQIFTADGTSRLRHAAARKYLLWRKAESPSPSSKPMELYSPLLGGSNNNGNSLGNSFMQQQQTPTASQMLAPSALGGTGSFALARVADHTQREERLAQIRLANWAGELQKSLANERARYEALARGERAVWLTERLNECVMDGTIVPVSSGGGKRRGGEKRSRRKHGGGDLGGGEMRSTAGRTHQDPLGLLEVVADLRRRGVVVLEVVGSLGLLGGMAVWVCRHYAQGGATYQWVVNEWERFWNGR